MEKDKSRGLKHINNKQKYKGNSTKNPKNVPPKSKPVLDSNWDRYEKIDEDNKQYYKGNSAKNPKNIPPKSLPALGSNWDRYEKNDGDQGYVLTDSIDFSVLASAPVSRGKHFQFKNEKLLAEEIKTESTSRLFQLDLMKLEESILSIPFFERVTIDDGIFSKQQITVMKAEADSYNKKLMEMNDPLKFDSFLLKDDMLLNIQDTEEIEGENIVKVSIKVEKPDDDLEEWLEDILNE